MKIINQSFFALPTLTLAMQAGAAGFALNESSALLLVPLMLAGVPMRKMLLFWRQTRRVLHC